MTSVGHDIVVISTFHSLIRHRGHHDGAACGTGHSYPSRSSTWFHLWFSWRCMLSCHLCLLISCYSLGFWILNFDCSFCLIMVSIFFLMKFMSLQSNRHLFYMMLKIWLKTIQKLTHYIVNGIFQNQPLNTVTVICEILHNSQPLGL